MLSRQSINEKNNDCNSNGLIVLQRLDAFFPFDPFHLPRSQSFINPHYQPWDGGEDNDGSEIDGVDTFDDNRSNGCLDDLEFMYDRNIDCRHVDFYSDDDEDDDEVPLELKNEPHEDLMSTSLG